MEPIGAGGMGQLYRVVDTGRKDAELALKMVRLQGSGISESELLEKFQQEFRLLTQLWHPNLIEVHDYGVTEGGDFYYTMDYVDGPNLSDAMAGMGIDQLVPTMVQICRALAYLHGRGIFHGDLKPANVLLAVPAGEQVRLVDFGLAQEMQVQLEGQRYITPHYAAPELAHGRRVDGRADLYSLGAIAYTWLVAEPPDFMLGTERLIAMALREALRAQPEVPHSIDDVIKRLLLENPEQRYATANEVIEALNLATGSAYALETKETASSYALRTRFVGREAEMAQLWTSWEMAQGDQGQMVLISGESGVGKTRLVNELEVQVELEGVRVVWGQCLESGGGAYQPWREVLRVLLRYIEGVEDFDLARLGPVLATILPELWERSTTAGMAPPAELEPAAAQQRLNDAILRMLQAAAGARPTLVVIEDAHWADEATQLLIGFLARVLDFGGLMVCITYRSEEVGEDQLLHQLSGEPVKRIPLENLTPERTNELVESMLGMARLPQGMMEKIQGTTAGNTFFAQELIRSLAEEGVVLQRTLDGWRVDEQALAEVGLPDTIQQVIWRRLERLSPDTQMVLRWAAVVGVVFWDGVLADVSGVGKDLVARALSEAAEQELVILRDESSFASKREYLFVKPVMQQVSYASIPGEEQRAAHAGVVTWMLARPDNEIEAHLGQIAEHLEGAGQIEQAVQYFRRAGEQAANQFANAEAISYLGRALELTPQEDAPRHSTQRYDLLLAREKVYALQGARQAQVRDLATLERVARSLADDRRRAEVALRRAEYAEATGDYPGAIAAAQEAIRYAQTAQCVSAEAEAYCKWGYALYRQGEYEAARLQLEQALALAQAADDRQVEAATLHSLGNSFLIHRGEFAKARSYYERALYIFRELGNRVREGYALNNLGVTFMYEGDYVAARSYYEQTLRLSRQIGARLSECYPLINLVMIYNFCGDYVRAKAHFEQVLPITRQVGSRLDECMTLVHSASTLQAMGDGRAALENSQLALRIAQEIGCGYAQGDAWIAVGQALEGLERLTKADEAYRQCLGIRRETGETHKVPHTLAGLARVALLQEDLSPTQAYAEEILSHMESIVQDGIRELPLLVHLTCYRVLHACQDPRAQAMLETAYQQLQERAARITDDKLRRSFLENVAAHREIASKFAQSEVKSS